MRSGNVAVGATKFVDEFALRSQLWDAPRVGFSMKPFIPRPRSAPDVPTTYAKEIASLTDLEADGLLKRSSTGVQVTPIGGPLLRVIAMRFDAYLSKAPNRHSKTI